MSATTRLPDLAPVAAAALLASGDAVLVDVREPDEWAAGHAPGAVHLAMGRVGPAALPTGRTPILICRSGNRSARAADLLAEAGVAAHNLAGGMQAWSQAGGTVVTDDGAPGIVA